MADRYLVQKHVIPEGALVPESVKRKSAAQATLAEAKAAAIKAAIVVRRSQRHALKMRTLRYNKEYKSSEKQLAVLRRQAKAHGNFFVEPEAKLIFVIRLVGVNKLAPKQKKILQLLRLRHIHAGVFLKVNGPLMQMLRLVAPLVAFGYPSVTTVRKLLYKRGFGKVNKQRIPLSDNQVISESLGAHGIHGVEDLVHEIATVGPHFKEANNFLWPFKLNSPKGGFVCKKHGYQEVSLIPIQSLSPSFSHRPGNFSSSTVMIKCTNV
jgi:large subunit ribosomal protein L7e